MNELFIVFANSLTALGFCLVIGFLCRRRRMLNDIHTSGFANFLVKVTLPCTVFVSFMRPFSRELLIESIVTFFVTGILYIIGGYLGLVTAKLMKSTPGERQSWQFGAAFGNVAFMGIPLVTAVFGEEGLIYVSMAMASFNLLAFTFGVRMFDNAPKSVNLKKLIIETPTLVALTIGIIFFVTGFRLPYALEGGVALIGSMTTPLSMVFIGSILAKQRLKDALMDFRLLPVVGIRLVIVPLLSFFVLNIFIENELMLGVIVTLMAMPVAAITAIFAEQFEADAMAAAKYVVVSTIICVITVPVLSFLL